MRTAQPNRATLFEEKRLPGSAEWLGGQEFFYVFAQLQDVGFDIPQAFIILRALLILEGLASFKGAETVIEHLLLIRRVPLVGVGHGKPEHHAYQENGTARNHADGDKRLTVENGGFLHSLYLVISALVWGWFLPFMEGNAHTGGYDDMIDEFENRLDGGLG